jgi:hypothetical protein
MKVKFGDLPDIPYQLVLFSSAPSGDANAPGMKAIGMELAK